MEPNWWTLEDVSFGPREAGLHDSGLVTAGPFRAQAVAAEPAGAPRPLRRLRTAQPEETHVSKTADERPVNLKALAALPAEDPVVMVNLLKFHSGDGPEHYARYAREVAPHLQRVGASVRYGGSAPVNVIGDGERPWWDAILVVEYPSPRAFTDMVTDPGYQEIHHHRAAALERGDLIATSHWALGQ